MIPSDGGFELAPTRPEAPAASPQGIHARLIARHMPASVLVDAADDVIHCSPSVNRYLKSPGSDVAHDIGTVVGETLSGAFRDLIAAARRSGNAVSAGPLTFETEQGPVNAIVHADPAGASAPAGVVLLVFEEQASTTSAEHQTHRIRQLEADLERENNDRLAELAKVSMDLKLLLESTGIATLFLNRELKIVRYTPEMRDIFDATGADQGRPLADLKHGLHYDNLDSDIARVLEHLTPIEREIEGPGGRWFLSRMRPYRSAPHWIDGVVITLVDITDRKRAEQELREQARRKDEFLALLAHELRNPLAPIITGVEVLRRTNGSGATTEPIIATIGRQAKQLVRLVDDLLDVSRVTGRRLRLRVAPVKLADIVRDALAIVQPLVETARHELVVHATEETIVLNADATRLTQVLANLLNNAARYTPNGGHIELSAQREGEEAVITVKDDGYGIRAQNVAHVFEMFYQGDDPRTARQSGLGIGLTLAKSLVEMHGGKIAVESAGTDRGSEFTLRLPIPKDVHAHVDSANSRTAPISGHRVLIVDDNADAAETLRLLIDTLGQNDVHVEFSGAAALAMATDFRPDVAIVDLKMPEMDGYEVARRLRAQPGGKDILLVALTGWALDEHKRRAQAAGFDHHLTKPADRKALEALLASTRPRPRLPPAETIH